MKRRISQRARTDFPVTLRTGALRSGGRGIEVSATGIVVDRGRPVEDPDMGLFSQLELELPERSGRLSTVARPVWAYGHQQAFRFIDMSDVDRLCLAEHLDLLSRRRALFF